LGWGRWKKRRRNKLKKVRGETKLRNELGGETTKRSYQRTALLTTDLLMTEALPVMTALRMDRKPKVQPLTNTANEEKKGGD